MSGTRNSNLWGRITIVFVICCCCLPVQAKYAGGTGEPNNPYLIADANDMNEIGIHQEDWDSHFLLVADIDLSAFTGTSFNIIGYYIAWNDNKPFTGVFDGNGKRISNFSYTSTGTNYIGLFGDVAGENAIIKDLGLIDPNVDAGTGDNVGALVSQLSSGTISGCYAEGGSVSGDDLVGGLVGSNRSGTISNCYSSGNVLGGLYVGGLIGQNGADDEHSIVSNCYSTCDVTGYVYVGGLVGRNINSVSDCYCTGNVNGISNVGGLCGRNNGTISQCYANGSIIGSYSLGGLVGWNSGIVSRCHSTGQTTATGNRVGGLVGINAGTITNCYSIGDVNALGYVGGLVGANGGSVSNCYSTGSVCGTRYYAGGLAGENDHGIISNCYATGSVSGLGWQVGGLVGRNYKGEVVNAFWDIETSGQATSAVGTPKTTEQMKDVDTFLAWGVCGNEGIWTIDSGQDYPRLAWQNFGGIPIAIADPGTLYGGGSGETNDPYLIYTAEQLNTIGLITCDLEKHFKMMADIDLSAYTGTQFNIIGNYENPFTGIFDGNGHLIFNFAYLANKSNVGLFGHVGDPNAQVKDLTLIDTNVDGGTGARAGAVVGYLSYGTISNCGVEGGSVSGRSGVGGLVGENMSGTISNCHATVSVRGTSYSTGGLVGVNRYGVTLDCYTTGSVEGEDYTGGLIGQNGGPISNCYALGNISGDDDTGGLIGLHIGGTILDSYARGNVSGGDAIGGLVGNSHALLSRCYATGHVEGGNYIGGLIGYKSESTILDCFVRGTVNGNNYIGGLIGAAITSQVSNCYATGTVEGEDYTGGLIGWNELSTVSNCYAAGCVNAISVYTGGLIGVGLGIVSGSYWDIQTSGQSTSAGGTGLPTAEMQTRSTFTDAGWDFVGETVNGIEDIWFIPQQDYPHLWWEGMQVPMKLTPRTLNCRSKGNWVKAHLTLPEGFTVADVDSNRPAVLHSFGFESAPLYVSVNKNKLVEIKAAFEREAVCSLTGDWPEALTVAGFLTDGNIFLGTSTVRMITPGLKEIEELALYWLNADCNQPDWCDGIDMNRDSMVNLLDYALLLNSQVEFVSE